MTCYCLSCYIFLHLSQLIFIYISLSNSHTQDAKWNRCTIILAAFVRLFSTVYFQRTPTHSVWKEEKIGLSDTVHWKAHLCRMRFIQFLSISFHNFYTIAINICSEKAGKDATELSLVVIALSAPSGQRVAPILDTSPLNRTNCAHQKIGRKNFFLKLSTWDLRLRVPRGMISATSGSTVPPIWNPKKKTW